MKKIKVGLLYGGRSGEHEVSLQTALSVIRAFDQDKYEIYPFYISKKGEWFSGERIAGGVEHVGQLTFDAQAAVSERISQSAALAPIFSGLIGSARMGQRASISASHSAAGAGASASQLDVIFPLLHGTFGEDGTVQGMLEMANIPYVGAGVLASAVGMDKAMMKTVFAQAGLPQCLYRYFVRSRWENEQDYFIMEIETVLGYPCFVKPANLGSSVGISKARNRQELVAAVDLAFQFDRKVIVEEAIDAREIEVSVLGNEEPRASVPGEIVFNNEYYDYQAKYIDGQSTMIIPAELSPQQAETIQQMAVDAFQAIDGSGLARVDFFLGRTDGRVMINEINTMPGFTPFSMYPMLWKGSGLSYQALLDELIELAFERHDDRQKLNYAFETAIDE